MMKFQILNIKDFTESQFQTAFENMSEERMMRCLRYKFIDDRRRMAFGDELLKKLIVKEYKANEDEIELNNLPSGNPVASVKGKEVFVSITHSGDFVACAVSDTPVGIDLEAKREIKPSVLARALTSKELEFIAESNKDEHMEFLKFWTAKEAYVKLTGEGLAGLSKADVLPLIKNGENQELVLKTSHTDDYACTVIYKCD